MESFVFVPESASLDASSLPAAVSPSESPLASASASPSASASDATSSTVATAIIDGIISSIEKAKQVSYVPPTQKGAVPALNVAIVACDDDDDDDEDEDDEIPELVNENEAKIEFKMDDCDCEWHRSKRLFQSTVFADALAPAAVAVKVPYVPPTNAPVRDDTTTPSASASTSASTNAPSNPSSAESQAESQADNEPCRCIVCTMSAKWASSEKKNDSAPPSVNPKTDAATNDASTCNCFIHQLTRKIDAARKAAAATTVPPSSSSSSSAPSTAPSAAPPAPSSAPSIGLQNMMMILRIPLDDSDDDSAPSTPAPAPAPVPAPAPDRIINLPDGRSITVKQANEWIIDPKISDATFAAIFAHPNALLHPSNVYTAALLPRRDKKALLPALTEDFLGSHCPQTNTTLGLALLNLFAKANPSEDAGAIDVFKAIFPLVPTTPMQRGQWISLSSFVRSFVVHSSLPIIKLNGEIYDFENDTYRMLLEDDQEGMRNYLAKHPGRATEIHHYIKVADIYPNLTQAIVKTYAERYEQYNK
jgi:hypothetical protein